MNCLISIMISALCGAVCAMGCRAAIYSRLSFEEDINDLPKRNLTEAEREDFDNIMSSFEGQLISGSDKQ